MNRRDPVRRRGAPSTYDRRKLDIGQLFFESTWDEESLRPTRANDVATRSVLADALEERGMGKLAGDLRRFPPDRGFHRSLLRQKIRRAIFGPQPRFSFTATKPERTVLLANTTRHGWLEIDRWLVDEAGGRDYVFITPVGYDHTVTFVRAADETSALEAAEEWWPNLFPDDDDEEDEGVFTQIRVPRVVWARLISPAASGAPGEAYVDDRHGIVEFR